MRTLPSERTSSITLWLALLLVVVAFPALAACGSSNGATSSTPSLSPGEAGATPSAATSTSPTPLPAPTVTGTIAFAKMLHPASGYNSDIYVVNADGTGLKRLTHDPFWEERPTWSPDGSKIAYSIWRGDHVRSIWVMNADGSGKVQLTRGVLDAIVPVWSPDGSQIAFWKDQSGGQYIYVMNADGSGVRPAAGGISVWEQNQGGNQNGGGMGWTPDGKILFIKTTQEYGDVFAVGVDGSGLTQLTNGAQLGTFSLSPDGTRIALNDHAYRVYVAPVKSAGESVTLMNPLYNYMDDLWAAPSWSPDGKALAIATSSIEMAFDSTASRLYVVNADGTSLSMVPGITRAFDPAWRPQ